MRQEQVRAHLYAVPMRGDGLGALVAEHAQHFISPDLAESRVRVPRKIAEQLFQQW